MVAEVTSEESQQDCVFQCGLRSTYCCYACHCHQQFSSLICRKDMLYKCVLHVFKPQRIHIPCTRNDSDRMISRKSLKDFDSFFYEEETWERGGMSNFQYQSLVGEPSGLGQTKNAEDGLQKEAIKAIMLDLFHHDLKPIMENLIHNFVKEELRNLLTGLERNHENHVSVPRHLKLKFLKNVALTILTGEEIRGEGCTSIGVALVDQNNENVIDFGPEASAKVEIVVLRGDFGGAKGDNWTFEEFNEKVVREREGIHTKGKKNREREDKTPLLTGNTVLNLNKGIGFLRNIKFRQYSNWMRNHEFKLGARVLDMFSGKRIKEAVTESFIVKDRRGTCDRKGQRPSLSDDVSKLKNIRRGGNLYKHLHDKKVNTVKDFLIQLFRDPEGLKYILGLEENLWEITVNHARQCTIDKRMWYYFSSQHEMAVVFNVVDQVMGIISRCQYIPMNELSEKQKADAHNLVITAFDHWEDIIFFYDKNSLLQHVSSLSTSEEPSNSPRPGLPSGYTNDATKMIQKQSDSSFGGIISSLDSSTHVSATENFGSLCDDNNLEVPREWLSCSSQYPSILNSNSMKSMMEIAETYFRQEKARKRWKMLSIALRISKKKVLPLGEIHVQKKQKVS